MRRVPTAFALLVMVFAVSAPNRGLFGQEAGSVKMDDRAGRLAEMTRLVGAYTAFGGEESDRKPVELRREPVHRWNDPTRAFSDGTLWAWGKTGRPIAIVAVELYPRPEVGRGEAFWAFEFVSLSTQPFEVIEDGKTGTSNSDGQVPEKYGRVHWAPAKPGVTFREISHAPKPARSASLRLVQMKDLMKRFSAHEFYLPDDQRIELRLMPRPIDRYESAKSGLLDGAIFTFANGTNPEVMVLIEAQGQTPAEATWRYAIARLTRARYAVKLDQGEIWTEPETISQRPIDTYFAAQKPWKPSPREDRKEQP